MKREELNKQLRFIMRYAHKIFKDGTRDWSNALKLSWAITRCKLRTMKTKVRGISHHQTAVESLKHLNRSQYNINIVKEHSNPYDQNALAVVAIVEVCNRMYRLKLGYLSKNIAKSINRLFGNTAVVKVLHSCITGQGRSNGKLGMNITYAVI